MSETLQASLGLWDRKSFREHSLNPALTDGLFYQTGPEKGD